MGRIFTDQTLATFENGTVFKNGEYLISYEDCGGYCSVYRYTDNTGNSVLSGFCAANGTITAGDGRVLGYCRENGLIVGENGMALSYYEGDMYGAAAAAFALLFNGLDKRTYSGLGATFGVIFRGVIRFIVRIPFWLPYALACLLPLFTMSSTGAVSTSSGVDSTLAGLMCFVYIILHSILIHSCKKYKATYRYWPIYASLPILLVSYNMMFIPIVAFQIGVLIWLHKQKKEG